MTDIEIPYEKDRSATYRFFEILPGALSWSIILLPLLLSLINVTLAAFFILGYVLIFFTRAMASNIRAISGYRAMRHYQRVDWNDLIDDIEAGEVVEHHQHVLRPDWHHRNIERLRSKPSVVAASEIIHAIVIATYNESIEVLEPTIQSVVNSDFDIKRVILVIAYEERGGSQTSRTAQKLISKYKRHFYHAEAVMHPRGIEGEVIGKGGNITHAGRWLKDFLESKNIDPIKVAVTTLDADNRPDKKYLSALTYLYAIAPDPTRVSYQPLPMFTNNIWDAPAPMRVIATGHNFFYIVQTQRPHLERNFSAHAQSMRALIDMNFWSVRTIVEDGHHFWRSYFFFDGNYSVYPIYVPIYQDAVLSSTYLKTIRAQFIQLRRWTYGASDIAYIAHQGFFKQHKVPRFDVLAKFLRTLEGHVSWASGAILMTFAAFIPSLIDPQNYAANELPIIVSRVQTIGVVGLLASMYIALKTLPPRPLRYKKHRSIYMVLQWAYLPITSIGFGALAALNSQTRLIFKRYLTKFDVTDKAVVLDELKTNRKSIWYRRRNTKL